MATLQEPLDAATPRRRARRAINILVVANPDHSSSEEDTPANSATFYSSAASNYSTAQSRPPTTRAPSPRRPSSPRRQIQPLPAAAASPRTIASPSPTSYVSASGSSARSSNSPGPESTPPPPTPSHGLPPLDLAFTAKQSHVTPNLPVGEDSDNQPESSAAPHVPYPPHVRRTSDGTRAIQSPSTRRPFSPPGRQTLSPPQRTPLERIIVAVTHDAENYVVVDITGQTDAQAIRERILSKLHIPDDLHASFAIYRTELGGFAIGGALDNDRLLIDCQHFGDDRGSLKFLAQRADAPTDDVDIPAFPPAIAPVPPMLPSQSTFSPGAMRMPSMSRRPGSASPASDRLVPEAHSNGYEASVSAISDFDLPDSENTSPQIQTRSPIQTLHRQAASRRGRQPSSSSPVVRRQAQGLPSQSSSPDRVSSSSSLTATRPHERRGSVTPTPPATRSPPGRDANHFDESAAGVVPTPSVATTPTHQQGHGRRGSETVTMDSGYERDLALAAEERRREDERRQWQAKRDAELQQKRQQWMMTHPGRAPPGESGPTPASNGMYGPGGNTNGYNARGSLPNGMYPPQRTGSAHGRRSDGTWSGSEQQYRAYHAPPAQQPHAPVRQQAAEPYYPRPYPQQQQQQQPVRQSVARQPSPQGGYGQPYVNQQQPYHPQQQPVQQQPAQPPYPNQGQLPQSQYATMHQTPIRTLPPGPPRGAMPPRTPGADYNSQGQAAPWFGGPGISMGGYEQQEGPYRGSGIGRSQSPQLRGGARSMGNLRDASSAQAPPPPPIPAAPQWSGSGGRGPSPSQIQGPGALSPGMQAMSPPVQPMSPPMTASMPPHSSMQPTLGVHSQQHGSPLPPHGSPLQHAVQSPLPPPSMQQYQQQQQHYDRPRVINQPVEQRSYIEPQRTGPSGYVEGGFGVIPTQNGQVAVPRPGDGRLDRNERYDREREKQEPVAIQRNSRQQANTSPVPTSGYPSSMPTAPRVTNEFGTSPRPAQGPLSNWGSQSMNVLPVARQTDTAPYYNGTNNNPNATMMARRTFSGDTSQLPNQSRPQSAYDSPHNAASAAMRQPVRPGPRPLTEYENRPSPSELYRPPPLPHSSQSQPQLIQHPQLSASPPTRGYTVYGANGGMSDTFVRRILDERVDDLYGGIEEQSASPLSVNTMLAPPPYEPELESASPSSVAGEVGQPSPMPLTPEPFHAELSESRTASPSASDASTVGYTGHTRETDSDCDSTTAVSDTAESTLKGDYSAHMAAIAKMVSEGGTANNGAATPAPVPSRTASQSSVPLPQSSVPLPQPSVPVPAKIIPRDFGAQEEEDEEEYSDEDSGTLWQVPKQNSTPATSVSSGSGTSLIRRTATRPKGLTVRIDGTRPSSQADSSPASTLDSAGGGTLIAPTLPLEVRKKTATNTNAGSGSGSGGDTVTRPPLVSQASSHRGSQGWDIRPQAEEVYEKLEQFFPNHDLDKPVIDAPSGGTSPITTEAPPIVGQPSPATPALGGPGVRRHKKSIRVVAAERQKMMERIRERVQLQTPAVDEVSDVPDSDSTIQPGTANILRKRSTKMWGGRVEEVRPGATVEVKPIPNVPETIPEGRQRPTFKWVKGQLIGRGSFGRVYHAMNLTTGEMIAVKQVELPKTESDKADSRQTSVVEALKSESNTLRDLDHPHIVQYLGFERTSDTLSIFLEYVPGGSIGSILRKYGKFEDEVVRSFSRQIIDGLAYLHSSGILHRDLKGDNILVDRSGICKISDFGISKRSEHVYNNHEGTAMQGSVFWMAPEMLHSNKQGYNAKIDIWSVGCVVLEMQAGRRPWTEDDMFAVMYKVGGLRQAPPVPEDVVLSPLADDFRQKCFAVDPAERPTAAELLTHPWLKNSPGWVFTGLLKQQ
ncbi:STE/STE11 kinase [Ceratobasidium sp. AG-Ba]|nr:STE/STE11 kinase [Ceratobasidium sp. AG-Ba]